MRWAKPILWIAVGAAAALLFASDGVWAQCAMCRTALLKSPEGQELAQGFNSGILFLLSAPFMVGGVIAFAIIRARLGKSLRGSPGSRPNAVPKLEFLSASTATRSNRATSSH